jgi:hypothetical protein
MIHFSPGVIRAILAAALENILSTSAPSQRESAIAIRQTLSSPSFEVQIEGIAIS